MHYSDLANALKNDADLYMCDNTWRDWRKKIFKDTRDIPNNVHFVPCYEKGKYDLAILSLDQQCINIDIGKRKIYSQLKENIGNDIPIIVINHGSPVYPEYAKTFKDDEKGKKVPMTDKEAEEECRKGVRELTKGTYQMVTNSYTAASEQEWGWGYPIRHGLNPKEWYDLPKEPRVFTALSPGGCDTYYNREGMNRVAKLLSEKGYKLWWAKINANRDYEGVEEYKDWLGRSLVYVDTSFRTPLNRSRSEAMLSGCCVIQVKGDEDAKAHDLDYFAEDGKNIILVENDPQKIVDIAMDMVENRYDEAVEIGKNARKTIIEKFNYKQFREKWLQLIDEALK